MEFKVAKNNGSTPCQLKITLNCLSIKETLQQQLSMSAILLDNGGNLLEKKTSDSSINTDTISLFKLKSFPITYRCALAYSLANILKLPVIDVAYQLKKSLLSLTEKPHRDSSLVVFPSVVSPGWLDFQVSEESLALWLEQLHCVLSPILPQNTPINSPLKYVHNRCFSLLNSAHRDGLIKLFDKNPPMTPWQWLEPKPIPWNIINTGMWQLNHPWEIYLIDQFCTVVDALGEPNLANREKLGINLSAAFLAFESSCRIWGEVKSNSLTLAQARLGLIAICQGLLVKLLSGDSKRN